MGAGQGSEQSCAAPFDDGQEEQELAACRPRRACEIGCLHEGQASFNHVLCYSFVYGPTVWFSLYSLLVLWRFFEYIFRSWFSCSGCLCINSRCSIMQEGGNWSFVSGKPKFGSSVARLDAFENPLARSWKFCRLSENGGAARKHGFN